MIKVLKNNLFSIDADIKINTVNCVGVMGKGIALEFKKRYPDMFKEYVKVCNSNNISPSNPFVYEAQDCIIINLPTKLHWRNPSMYKYIEANLQWLRNYLLDQPNPITVVMPALGCTNGGLKWSVVLGMIYEYLGDIEQHTIIVCEPLQ